MKLQKHSLNKIVRQYNTLVVSADYILLDRTVAIDCNIHRELTTQIVRRWLYLKRKFTRLDEVVIPELCPSLPKLWEDLTGYCTGYRPREVIIHHTLEFDAFGELIPADKSGGYRVITADNNASLLMPIREVSLASHMSELRYVRHHAYRKLLIGKGIFIAFPTTENKDRGEL